MRLWTILSTCAFGSLLLLGCGKGSKLAGNWTFASSGKAQSINGVATFNPDGTMQFEADNPATPAMKIDMIGKYREDGDKLFITFSDVAFKNTPAEAKGQEQQMKDGLMKQIDAGTEKARVIKWTSDTAFTTEAEGATMSFTKK